MSAKHTPGPWTQHEGEVRAKNYGLISRSYYGKPDGEGAANARLIAAAPELLEALKAMIEVHGVTQAYADRNIEIPQSWVEVSDIARAAIARAIG